MKIVENKINPNKNGPELADAQQKQPLIQYDPKKRYRWEPGSNFLLTGEQFGVIINSMRAILNTQEAQKILLADRANEAIEAALARAVEVGVAVEETGKPVTL